MLRWISIFPRVALIYSTFDVVVTFGEASPVEKNWTIKTIKITRLPIKKEEVVKLTFHNAKILPSLKEKLEEEGEGIVRNKELRVFGVKVKKGDHIGKLHKQDAFPEKDWNLSIEFGAKDTTQSPPQFYQVPELIKYYFEYIPTEKP
ncbi:MAG: hypothetical protein V5A57_00235 [Candidatus Paceibacterota bacterium]